MVIISYLSILCINLIFSLHFSVFSLLVILIFYYFFSLSFMCRFLGWAGMCVCVFKHVWMHLCEQAHMHVCAPVWGSLWWTAALLHCSPILLTEAGSLSLDRTDTARENSQGIFPLSSVALTSREGSKALWHSQVGGLGSQSSFFTCQPALQPLSHCPSPQFFILSCYSRANGKTLEESPHC